MRDESKGSLTHTTVILAGVFILFSSSKTIYINQAAGKSPNIRNSCIFKTQANNTIYNNIAYKRNEEKNVQFDALSLAVIKSNIFRGVITCSLVKMCLRFEVYVIQAALSTERFINFYDTTCYSSEESTFHRKGFPGSIKVGNLLG
jgi:hypothetical protein